MGILTNLKSTPLLRTFFQEQPNIINSLSTLYSLHCNFQCYKYFEIPFTCKTLIPAYCFNAVDPPSNTNIKLELPHNYEGQVATATCWTGYEFNDEYSENVTTNGDPLDDDFIKKRQFLCKEVNYTEGGTWVPMQVMPIKCYSKSGGFVGMSCATSKFVFIYLKKWRSSDPVCYCNLMNNVYQTIQWIQIIREEILRSLQP